MLRLLHAIAPQHPTAFGHVLQALDFHLAPVKEVAIVGAGAEPLERVVRGAFRPHLVRRGRAGRRRPAARRAASRSTAARPPTCASASPACGPVTEPDELAALLR